MLFQLGVLFLSLHSPSVSAMDSDGEVNVNPKKVLDGLWEGELSVSKLNEFDEFFLRSLVSGASKNPKEFEYFSKNKCKENSVKCYLVLSAGGNLLLDSGDQENGLKAGIYAYSLIHESNYCPIAYEIVVVNYKLRKLGSIPSAEASEEARVLLDKIARSGGVSNNLRTRSCSELRAEAPAYFEKYAGLVSRLMYAAGGDYRSYAAKIKTN